METVMRHTAIWIHTNIIYNSVALDLSGMLEKIAGCGIDRMCVSLTFENASKTETILKAFLSDDNECLGSLRAEDHTTGHMKRRTL